MKFIAALAVATMLAVSSGYANAATPFSSITNNRTVDYALIGAVVGGVAGGLLCLGHPVCVIAGAKLTALGGAAFGAGVGAASGTGVAVIAH